MILTQSQAAREEELKKKEKLLKKVPYYIATAGSKEEKALIRYKEMEEKWEKFNKKVCKRLGRDPHQTVFSKTDEYREKKEELALIDEKLPKRVGGENEGYWEQSLRGVGTRYITIGNSLTGISCEVKGESSDIKEHIRRGKVLSHEWLKGSKYLQNKLKLLTKKTEKEKTYIPPPDVGAELIVEGRELWEWVKTSHIESIKKIEDHISFIEQTEVRRSSMMTPTKFSRFQQSQQQQDNHYSIIQLPHNNNESDIDPYILEYMNRDTNEPIQDENYQLEILFDTFINKPLQRDVRVINTGTCVIYYDWTREIIGSRIEVGGVRVATRKSMKFFCNNMKGSILPNEYHDFTFTFQSSQSGVFREQWKFNTQPSINSCHVLLLRAAAISMEENLFAKQQIIESLDRAVETRYFHEFSKDIVERVHTPPPRYTPEEIEEQRKKQFEKENPTLYYSTDVYNDLNVIINQCFDLLDFPDEDRVWNLSVDVVEDLVKHIASPPEVPEQIQPEQTEKKDDDEPPEDENNDEENDEEKPKKPKTPEPIIELTPLQQMQKDYLDRIDYIRQYCSIRPNIYSHYCPIVEQILYDIINEIPECSYQAEKYVGFQFRDWVPPIIPHDYNTGFKKKPAEDQPLIPMNEESYNSSLEELNEIYKNNIQVTENVETEQNNEGIENNEEIPKENEEQPKENNEEQPKENEEGEINQEIEDKIEEFIPPILQPPQYNPTIENYRDVLYTLSYNAICKNINTIESLTYICDYNNTNKMISESNMQLGYKKKIKDVDYTDKRVLIRADLDFHYTKGKGDALVFPPIEEKKLNNLISEVNDILSKNAYYVVIIANYRNPKSETEKDLSLSTFSKFLKKSFKNLIFVEELTGPKADKAFQKIAKESVFLIENIYFQHFEKGDIYKPPLLRSMLPHVPDCYVKPPEMNIPENVRTAYNNLNNNDKKGAKSKKGKDEPVDEPVEITPEQMEYLNKEKYINTLNNLFDIYINDCYQLCNKCDVCITDIGKEGIYINIL